MNARFAAPARTRIAALAAAVLTSAVVLGATVLGMQPGSPSADAQVIALERVLVTATAVN